MHHYSPYIRRRILALRAENSSPTAITKKLEAEGFKIHRHGVGRLLQRYKERGNLSRKRHPPKRKLLSTQIYSYIDKVFDLVLKPHHLSSLYLKRNNFCGNYCSRELIFG